MLNHEAAQKRLRDFRSGESLLSRARRLPDGLRPLGMAILDRNPDGKAYVWGARDRDWPGTQSELEADPEARLSILRALFPALAEVIEAGWRLYDRLPYGSGHHVQPFRVPPGSGAPGFERVMWLHSLTLAVGQYDQDARWVAAWAPYLGEYHGGTLGCLLAAAIESGGAESEAVFETLAAIARGEHEIGAMGRHVTTALLCASRPDGWELVERLLLAAQRQEGLRQAILESVCDAHPEAFRRMLRLILDHDLQRFSATVRAFDVWFGLALEVDTAPAIKAAIHQTLTYLEQPDVARQALATAEDARTVYTALWSQAFTNAYTALDSASRILREDPLAARRSAAAYLLGGLGLDEALGALIPALDDPELEVAWTAFQRLRYADAAPDLFEPLVRLMERSPKRQSLELAWAGTTHEVSRAEVAGSLAQHLGERSPTELVPYLGEMEGYARAQVVDQLADLKKPGPDVRRTLFALVGDPNEYVRSQVFKALEKQKVGPEEAKGLEKLLTRKSADLRRGVLTLLLKQPDDEALASAERLLQGSAPMRPAGLELLAQMADAERKAGECRTRAAEYRAGRPNLPSAEEELLALLLDREREVPTLDDALGLMDPNGRTPPKAPEAVPGVELRSEPSRALVASLDALIKKNRERPVVLRRWDDSEAEQLLGNVHWGFTEPDLKLSAEADAARLPLRELWEEWWSGRAADTRDPDGRELLRAIVSLTALKGTSPKQGGLVAAILQWMLRLHGPADAVDFLLDAAETSLTEIPESALKRARKWPWDDTWQQDERRIGWFTLARAHRDFHPEAWRPEHHARFWGLIRWIDEPGWEYPRHRPALRDLLAALGAGAATVDDLFDTLLGPAVETGYDPSFGVLRAQSGRKPTAERERSPELEAAIRKCRERIIEVELERGDLPTAASKPALALRHSGGASVLAQLVRSLGKLNLVRGYIYSDEGKAATFSHLIRATHPGEGDTPEAFARAMEGIPEKRLLDVAFYAPQWSPHVEHALGWPSLGEAIWWIHAHTKDEQWSVDEEIRGSWTAQVAERTPLAGQSLLDGAVDVEWFRRVHAALGTERWATLDDSAKYASGGGGHKRAQLFADAMLGRVTRETLVARIHEKRNQDALRALGLLPLPDGPAHRREVLDRYRIIQEFLRGSRQFGAQKQASEKLAAGIAMENLARTAGYPDPIRLEWAMEAEAIADLAAGPVSATAGEVTVTLSIDPWGEPDLSIVKAGKALKSLPAAAKKDEGIAALQARKKEVERQASRMRLSLEGAMCRGDAFLGSELAELLAHPVLAPMLRNLVFTNGEHAGYPVEGGRGLESASGQVHGVSAGDMLRVAHPHDLFHTGAWDHWQGECFRRERIQPFKQVFRELYLLTEAEQTSGFRSRRYEGHQVNSNQARAILGKRGWVSNPEEGDVRRTFHREGLTAWIGFDYGYTTPAEVEGLTLDTVGFSRRGSWEPLALTEVPPRIFSEVMRDVDLVVSVAHQGGVDPEATASTVEMRAALLRETARLLKLENLRFQSAHVLIDGKLATYSLHLGSAVVHRQPGGHLCIVPVHSQHRGRIFLPFADNDPKTAEVLSKALLLAKDHEIQDPTILEQIFAR